MIFSAVMPSSSSSLWLSLCFGLLSSLTLQQGSGGALLRVVQGFHISTKTTTTSRRANTGQYWSLPPSPSCSCLSAAVSSSSSLQPGVDAIDAANDELEQLLSDLREEHAFFRLYSVDMLGSCEYMPQELFECYSESCEIYPVDEEEIPADISRTDAAEFDFELDGWARWDMPTEDYYDTTQFPEEFTGYDGSAVWRFIHDRICFRNAAAAGDDEYTADNWKADFNRAVSGLHSMISAQVVRGIADKVAAGESLDEVMGGQENVWKDAAVEFQRRLSPTGETPQALENMYFTYMLLLTAVSCARVRLLQDCKEGKINAAAAADLQSVLQHSLLEPDAPVQVASRTLVQHAQKDLEEECTLVGTALWEARMRTRELMRIMNCVQCNKCRLHGKIAVLGLSTAFQILLGRTGESLTDLTRIHRVELAALMTTLSKFATATKFCQGMMTEA